jgi:hypothetical protein
MILTQEDPGLARFDVGLNEAITREDYILAREIYAERILYLQDRIESYEADEDRIINSLENSDLTLNVRSAIEGLLEFFQADKRAFQAEQLRTFKIIKLIDRFS